MNSWHDVYACSDPDIVPDDDFPAFENISVRQIMIVCHDSHMRTDLDVVPEFDPANRHSGEIVIDKDMLSEGYMN